MLDILCGAVCFGLLLSFVVLWVQVASQKGAILYFPVRCITETVKRAELQEAHRRLMQEVAQSKSIEEAQQRQRRVEMAEERLLRYDMRFKPFLTCASCMPSVWGVALLVTFWLSGVPVTVYQAVFGILFSSVINTIVVKRFM